MTPHIEIAVVSLIAGAAMYFACTTQQAAQVTALSAEACVRIALCVGRTDIATYCGIADDIATTLVAQNAGALYCPIDAGAQ